MCVLWDVAQRILPTMVRSVVAHALELRLDRGGTELRHEGGTEARELAPRKR